MFQKDLLFVDIAYRQVSRAEYQPSKVFHFLLIDKQLSLPRTHSLSDTDWCLICSDAVVSYLDLVSYSQSSRLTALP